MAITINEALEGLKGSDALIGRPIAARIDKTSDEDVTRQLNYVHRTMVGNLNQANKNIITFTKFTKQEIRKQDAQLLLVSDTINSIKIAFKGITEKVHRLEYKVRNLSYQKPSAVSNVPKIDKTSMGIILTAVLSSLIPIIKQIIDWWRKSKSDDKKDDATAEKKDQAIPEQDNSKIEAQAILIESATTIDITVADTLSAEAKNILLSADEILLESGELLFSTTPIISNTDGIADTWEAGPDAEQQQSKPERTKPPDSRGGGGSPSETKSRRRDNLNAGVAGSTGDLSSQLGIGNIGGGTSLGGGTRSSGGGGGSSGPDETGHVHETPPTYDPTKISKDTIFDPITSNNSMGGVGADSASRGHGAHQGEDWGAPVGTPVYAVRDGCIVRHSRDNFGKLVVVIRHDDGTYTRDMHLQEDSALPVGTRVKGGQQYALSGTANGVPHLHHERWSGPPNKSQLISPSQEAGRNRKDGMKGGQARQGGKIIEPDVAKPTVGPVSDIPAKEVGSQQYASTAEDTLIPENAQLTQGQVLSDATPDNVTPGQQYAGLTTTDKSTDTAVAERDKTVGTTDIAATDPNQPAPEPKGVLKPSPGGIEAILRGFFGRPKEPELPPIPKGQQITPVPPYQPPVEPETPAPVPVEPPATETPSITPQVDPPKIPEPPPPPPPPPPTPPASTPAEPEVPTTASNPEQETQAPNSGSYGDAPSSRDHNSGICII